MASQPNPAQPDRVGPFTVEGHLGAGGMGEVYRVRDEAFDRELALKVIRAIAQGDEQSALRFAAEGRLTGQLLHPAVPPVYHLAKDEKGHWFYTMLRVRGRSLSEIVKEHQTDPDSPWTLRRLLGLFVSVCNGVAYAHARGVIHRDLKPQNVIVGDYGQVYVVDWGLAKVLGRDLNLATEGGTRIYLRPKSMWEEEQERLADQAAQQETFVAARHDPDQAETMIAPGRGVAHPAVQPLRPVAKKGLNEGSGELPLRPWAPDEPSGSGSTPTLQGSVLGTPAYMAPEQARGEVDRLDQRADVFALGAILFEMLAGKPLRQGKKGREVLKEACAGRPPNFETIARTRRIEPELRDICLRALEPEVARRYAKVPDLVADVKAYLDGDRRWKVVYEADFSKQPDSDQPPARWVIHSNRWGLRGGTLCALANGDSIIHLSMPVEGDVRVEIEGWVEPDATGEISPILCAPAHPARKLKTDGYMFEFGANDMQCSKLSRDEQDVAVTARAIPVPGRVHRVLAERLEQVLRMEADGVEILRLRDFFPLAGPRVGLYGFGSAVRIRRFKVWSAGVPKQQSSLAVPNELAALKLWDKALAAYRRVMESHPGSAHAEEAAFKAGLCLLELKRHEEARVAFDGLKESPLAPLAYVGLSVWMERTGVEPVREGALLADGLAVTAECPEGLADVILRAQVRAHAFEYQGDFLAAGTIWEALAKCTGADREVCARAKIEWAHCRYMLGGQEELFGLLDAVAQGSETSLANRIKAVREAGQAACALGQFGRARDYFNRGLSLCHSQSNEFGWCSVGIAGTLYHEGRFKEAIEYAQGLLKVIHASFSNGLLMAKAACHLMDGTWEQAISILQGIHRNIAISTYGRAQTLTEMGKICMAAGRHDEADAYMEQVLREFPNERLWCAWAFLHRIRKLLRQGLLSESEEVVEQMRRTYPDLRGEIVEALLEQGVFCRRTRRFEEARSRFQQILKDYQKHKHAGAIWRELGHCLRDEGRIQEAREMYYRALKECLNSRTTLEHSIWLGLMEMSLGARESAQHAWSNILPGESYRSGFLSGSFWMLRCMCGAPYSWKRDERGVDITPGEALRRTALDFRSEAQEMLDFRAAYDPAWKPWASDPNPFEKG